MAKLEYRRLSDYLQDLVRECGGKEAADGIMKQILYDGAGTYFRSVKAAASQHGNLADGVIITKHHEDNGWYTKIKFMGYDPKDGKAWALKAAVINSGTSDGRVDGNRFFSKAIQAVDAQAQAAMDTTMHDLIKDIVEGK